MSANEVLPGAAEVAVLTAAQREAARAGYDPDHTLTDAELAEIALDGLRFAAAELRRLADEDQAVINRLRWTADLYSSGLPANLWPEFDRRYASMTRLRARADELDGGAR